MDSICLSCESQPYPLEAQAPKLASLALLVLQDQTYRVYLRPPAPRDRIRHLTESNTILEQT